MSQAQRRRHGLGNRAAWAVVLLLLTAAPSLAVELEGPTPRDRNVTLLVTSMMNSDHLTLHKMDDEISQRCLENFLKLLDPLKVYFYQSDIDHFAQWRNKLDDMAGDGDVRVAYLIFNTFLERVDERVELVDDLLTKEFDFTLDEYMITDRDLRNYPRNVEEARDLWRKRIKYELLVLKDDETEGEEARDRLHRRYTKSIAQRWHQVDSDELLEMYLTSLTTAYDPHSSYMSPATVENFEIMMRLQLEGIGASLSSEDGYTVVKEIIPGGPAARDGRLKPEDKIHGVAQGTDGEILDVVDMKLNDVVNMIRGKRGTVVRLQVAPAGESGTEIYELTRDSIELSDREARGEVIEIPRGEQTVRLGVIDLPSFYMDMEGARQGLANYKSTTRDVSRLLADFRRQGVDALLIDLRRNGGGSLTEAINLTGLFIKEGPVVQVKDNQGRVQHYDDLDGGVTSWDAPIVVVTSKLSASASEIFAGALQDYGRGLIVGDATTHGKGTVQSLIDLSNKLGLMFNPPKLGALKFTMQQFYRPSGDSTQNRGVLADVALPSLTTNLDIGEADLDYALDFDRVPRVSLVRENRVNAPLVAQLNMRSRERQTQSEDFQRLEREISRYLVQKERKSVALNETKFMAERAEVNAEEKELDTIEEDTDPTRPVFERNYYGNEVLDIAVDYVQTLRSDFVTKSSGAASR